MMRASLLTTLLLSGTAALAQPTQDMVDPVTTFVGEMAVPMPGGGIDKTQIDNALRFEPIQSFDEMFLRDDVVFLMRHGPTDWSKLDVKDVAPTDCENQRVLSDEGREDMIDLGSLLAFNEIRFGEIIVSEWCRNQQTLAALEEGYDKVDFGEWSNIPVETNPALNLLLSLQGAPNVTDLRERISNWDGGDGDGPLLIISHFTNIQELTEFSVYEGEMLVIDPDRENRVLGYVRLRTAEPDVGHFNIAEQDAIYEEDGSVDEDAAEAAGAEEAGSD